jgi:hypothetical protein
MTEIEELEQARQKYNDMVELFDSDKFQVFYNDIMDIGEDLGKTLVFNFNGIKLEKKDAIINQMNFISGLKNYIDGMRVMKDHVDMEYQTYLESLEADKPANNTGE